MTEESRDPIALWHEQFAPATVRDGTDRDAPRAETVEHFADADGVFTAPVAAAVEVEPAPGAASEPKPDAKGEKGEPSA